jgi:hypothetical protein
VAPLAHPGQFAAVVAQVHETAVVRVGDVDVVGAVGAVAADGQGQRPGEAAVAAAQSAQRAGARRGVAGHGEAHDLVAAGVGHIEAIVAVVERRAGIRTGDVPRRAQAVDAADRLQAQFVELRDGPEDEHAVVAGVGHEDAVVPVGGQAARLAQRPEGRAGAVEGGQVAIGLAQHQAVPGGIRHDLEVVRLQVREAVIHVDVAHDDGRPGRAEQLAIDKLARRPAGQHVDPGFGQVRSGRKRPGRRGRGGQQGTGDGQVAEHVRLLCSVAQKETLTPVS